jgi:hypothetical protein
LCGGPLLRADGWFLDDTIGSDGQPESKMTAFGKAWMAKRLLGWPADDAGANARRREYTDLV